MIPVCNQDPGFSLAGTNWKNKLYERGGKKGEEKRLSGVERRFFAVYGGGKKSDYCSLATMTRMQPPLEILLS